MKTPSMIAALLLLAAPMALAQPGGPDMRAERAARMLERRLDLLDGHLELSDAQEARLRQVFLQHQTRLRERAEAHRADMARRREEMRARRAADARDPDAMRRRQAEIHAQMRTETDALDADVRVVLTPDQARRYDELRADERRRVEERMRHSRDRMRRDRMHRDRPDGRRMRRPGSR